MPGTLHHLTFRSYQLVREMRMAVYTPPGYSDDTTYPLLMALHPWGETERYFVEVLDLPGHLDRLIEAEALLPCIAVMPQGDYSYFLDAADPRGDYSLLIRINPALRGVQEGSGDYGTYLLEDVLPRVESTFRLRRDRAGRGMMGVGMGAVGAAVLALRHPECFGAVGLHNPMLFNDTSPPPPWIVGFNNPRWLAERDPIELAGCVDPAGLPALHLDGILDSECYPQIRALHRAFERQGIIHTFEKHPGTAFEPAWEQHAGHYLGFYAASW